MGTALEELLALLTGIVSRTSWVTQFSMTADFGVGDPKDPYVRACRAECMLATLLLFVEDVEVRFIDEDRLQVLQDAPTSEEVRAVRLALGLT